MSRNSTDVEDNVRVFERDVDVLLASAFSVSTSTTNPSGALKFGQPKQIAVIARRQCPRRDGGYEMSVGTSSVGGSRVLRASHGVQGDSALWVDLMTAGAPIPSATPAARVYGAPAIDFGAAVVVRTAAVQRAPNRIINPIAQGG